MTATSEGERSHVSPKNNGKPFRKDDKQLLGIKNRRLLAVREEDWRRKLRESRARFGLQCHID